MSYVFFLVEREVLRRGGGEAESTGKFLGQLVARHQEAAFVVLGGSPMHVSSLSSFSLLTRHNTSSVLLFFAVCITWQLFFNNYSLKPTNEKVEKSVGFSFVICAFNRFR